MLPGAIGGDSVLLSAIITALTRAYSFVLGLTLVEALAVLGHHLAKLPSQAVPIIKALTLLCGSFKGREANSDGRRCCGTYHAFQNHVTSPMKVMRTKKIRDGFGRIPR